MILCKMLLSDPANCVILRPMKNSSITIEEKTSRRLEAVVGRLHMAPAELLRLALDQTVCFMPVTLSDRKSAIAGTDSGETDESPSDCNEENEHCDNEHCGGENGMAVEIRDGKDDRLIALGTLVQTANGFAVRVVRLVSIILVMMTLMAAQTGNATAQISRTAARASSSSPEPPTGTAWANTTATTPTAATGTPLPGVPESGTPSSQIPGSLGSLLRTIAILGVMIVIFFLANRWLRRKFPTAVVPKLPEGVFEILGRAPFTSRQNVLLVRFGDRIVLIALTPDGPVPLSEIDDPRQVGVMMAKLGRSENREIGS